MLEVTWSERRLDSAGPLANSSMLINGKRMSLSALPTNARASVAKDSFLHIEGGRKHSEVDASVANASAFLDIDVSRKGSEADVTVGTPPVPRPPRC